VLEQFRGLVKRSFHQYINDSINERLKSALATDQQKAEELERVEMISAISAAEEKVQTTAEELEAFYIVRAIVCAKVSVNRVVHRDQQSYFGILLDDNNRKPICRLHLNGKKKYVSFFDSDKEEKIELSSNAQLYDYAPRLISAVEQYEKKYQLQ
jgi:predicted type IV restriction endonuclease